MEKIEVIRWISIVLLWIAVGLNVVGIIRMKRLNRELDNQVRIWKARNAYEEDENENV